MNKPFPRIKSFVSTAEAVQQADQTRATEPLLPKWFSHSPRFNLPQPAHKPVVTPLP